MTLNLNNGVHTAKRKVLWIHCNYIPSRLHRCLDLAETFLRKLGLLESAALICVNNDPNPAPNLTHVAWVQLQGSNQAREFSAWKEGWDSVRADVGDVDIVILTNDTFPFHQPYQILAPLLRVSLAKLIRTNANGWALGVVERGFDYDSLPEYITSFFVALDRTAALSVMPRITEVMPQCLIADNETSGKIVFSRDKKYEKNINNWLLNPSGQSWYAAAPLRRDNYHAMAGKARSIILEHSLSKNLRSDRIQLISCFDLPMGFLARWYLRIDHKIRSHKRY